MSCFVSTIPRDVLYLLADYLLATEEQQKPIFKYSYDLRNFVNTSKKYFGEWKKKTRVIVLSTAKAERFLRSSTFRNKVLSTIKEPLEQLELDFLYQRLTEISLNFTGGVRKINAERCRINEFSISCGDVFFQHCRIQKLPACSPFRKFEIHDSRIPQEDLNAATILEEAVLSETHPQNLHTLAGLRSLKLYSNYTVSDVSCLKNIPKLELVSCPYITDISRLANVHELVIGKYNGITDVSSLGRVHKLKFFYCDNLRDVSALGNVHHLEIDRCYKVSDVSALGNVHILHLTDCYLIRDISVLKNVLEIHLVKFEGTGVSGLDNVEKLFLTDCRSITDISMLNNIKVLSVEACPGVVPSQLSGLEKLKNLRYCVAPFVPPTVFDFSVLERLSTFDLTGINFSTMGPSISLHSLHDLTVRVVVGGSRLLTNPTLSHLRSLTLSNCQDDFTFLPEFPSLGYLTVVHCNQLVTLELSGRDVMFPIYSVYISNCTSLEKIETTRKISEMKISYCTQLRHIDAQTQIGHLTIDSCESFKRTGETLKNTVVFDKINSEIFL
jgi:hypothetical protein